MQDSYQINAHCQVAQLLHFLPSDWMNIRFWPAMLYAGLPVEPMGSSMKDTTHNASATVILPTANKKLPR